MVWQRDSTFLLFYYFSIKNIGFNKNYDIDKKNVRFGWLQTSYIYGYNADKIKNKKKVQEV